MRDWLTIQCQKGEDSKLSEFIQANPLVDNTMRTFLAKYLNLSEPRLQQWIYAYQNGTSECSQSHFKGDMC